MCLPVLAVKGYHRHFSDRSQIQTAHINAVAIRMGPRNVEGFDSAHWAKQMPGDSGVESVGREGFGTLDESEPRFWHDEMKKTAFAAD